MKNNADKASPFSDYSKQEMHQRYFYLHGHTTNFI